MLFARLYDYIRSLKFGDQIHCLGPLGQLCVDPAHGDGPIFLLATGSGVSPFKAIITDQLQIQQTSRELYLIWNVSYAREFFWLSDFQALEKSFPQFHFIPIVSRPDENWTLQQGYIQDYLAAIPLPDNAHYYLCGSPLMLTSTTDYLRQQRGVDQSQITVEQFFAPKSA